MARVGAPKVASPANMKVQRPGSWVLVFFGVLVTRSVMAQTPDGPQTGLSADHSPAPAQSAPETEPASAPASQTAPAPPSGPPPRVPPPNLQPPAPLQPVAQENFAFGPQIGFYNPNGLVLRLGARALSLDVTAGFVPVVVAYGPSQSSSLKFLLPMEVTPQLLIHVLTFRDDVRGGLRLGYRYNTALGHGATLGGQIAKRISPRFQLEGLWGVTYYPHASRELRGEEFPEGTNFNFPPEFGYGLSVGLLYYP